VDNLQIRRLWPPWEVMANTSRPLVQLSLAVNYALGGLDTLGYHAFNLTVHTLAGLVLFGIVRRTLGSEPLRARYAGAAPRLATAVAALWLVHPLQTESVTYIIQRAESLMGLFYLLTLYCVVRGSLSPHSAGWYITAVVACVLGMGSKEVMVTAPVLTLLYDRVFLSRSFADLLRRRWGLYAALAAAWGVEAALVATESTKGLTGLGPSEVSPWDYAKTQSAVIVHYVRLAFWPDPLVLDYKWPLAPTLASVAPWATLVLASLGATMWALRRQPPWGFLGAWFFLVLSPTSSIAPIADAAFEHRMYLPLAAVVALVVIGGHELLGSVFRRLAAPDHLRLWLEVSLLVVAVAALGYTTVRRNEDYRSEYAIWSDTVAKRPTNPRAHNNMGALLITQGRLVDATAHLHQAVRLQPDYGDAHNNLGLSLYKQRQLPEAITHLSEAVRINPNDARAHKNLGLALFDQGRLEEAIVHYSEALRVNPNDALTHYNLGLALFDRGRLEEAIAHYSEALRIDPSYAEAAHNNLGNALAGQGKLEEAVTHYAGALRINPDNALAHTNLGAAFLRQGKLKEALAHLSEALRLAPGAQAHYNLGAALVRDGQPREAIPHLETALKLNPGFQPARRALETLTKP